MLSVLRGTTSILVAWVPHTEGFTSRKHNWILGLLIFFSDTYAKIHLQRSPILFGVNISMRSLTLPQHRYKFE